MVHNLDPGHITAEAARCAIRHHLVMELTDMRAANIPDDDVDNFQLRIVSALEDRIPPISLGELTELLDGITRARLEGLRLKSAGEVNGDTTTSGK